MIEIEDPRQEGFSAGYADPDVVPKVLQSYLGGAWGVRTPGHLQVLLEVASRGMSPAAARQLAGVAFVAAVDLQRPRVYEVGSPPVN